MTTHSGDVLTDDDMEKLLQDAFSGALPEKTTSEAPATPVETVTPETETPATTDAVVTTPSAATQDTPDDPLATLPEAARAVVLAEIQRLQRERDQATQNYNAQLGRVRAMEKQRQQATQPTAPAKPVQPAEDDDWLKDVRGVDPELAKYLEMAESRAAAKAEQRFKHELEELRQRDIAPLHQSRVKEEELREEQILDQMVPNWRNAPNDPHFQSYAQSLPSFLQDKLQSATKADELLWFFDDYNRRFFPNAASGGDPAKVTTPPATQPSVTAQRQQKLATSVAPAGATPAAKPDVVDEAKLLEEAYKSGSSAGFYNKR